MRKLKSWANRNPRRWVLFDVLTAVVIGIGIGALAGAGF